MSASAGRVLLMPKGTYDAATTYEMLDLVRYGKSTFVCKKTSTGNTPDSNQDTEYWQLIATSGDVSGVKGNAEVTYREGNVNLTFADLGIDSALSSTSDNAVKNKAVYAALSAKQDTLTFDTVPTTDSINPVTSGGIKTALNAKLSTTDDTTTNVTTFTSSDDSTSTDKTSDGMTEVITMASGESHASLFQKISKMFLNVRKLWNTIGSTAIPSELGTTVTSALSTIAGRLENVTIDLLWSGIAQAGTDISLSSPIGNYDFLFMTTSNNKNNLNDLFNSYQYPFILPVSYFRNLKDSSHILFLSGISNNRSAIYYVTDSVIHIQEVVDEPLNHVYGIKF